MQKDWTIVDSVDGRRDVELSVWCSWRQAGLGIATMFGAPCTMIRLDLLCFGISITFWRF